MSEHDEVDDDILDSLPTGDAPAKKKATKKVRRRVKKKKKPAEDHGAATKVKTRRVKKTLGDTPPPPEAHTEEFHPDEFDHDTPAEEEFNLDSLPGDGEAVAEEDQVDPDAPVYEEPADDPLATLPTPTVPEEATRKLPKPEPTGATLPTAEAGKGGNVNARWDEFLMSLQQPTLVAVYELGIDSLTDFQQYHKSDLCRPRGRLTEPQADEVESKLRILGIELNSKPKVAGLRTGGGQHRIRGLRQEQALPPLPANATSQQKRQHRMARNRLSM